MSYVWGSVVSYHTLMVKASPLSCSCWLILPPSPSPLAFASRYVRLHFFDEDYLNKQDEVPDELEEGSSEKPGYEDN